MIIRQEIQATLQLTSKYFDPVNSTKAKPLDFLVTLSVISLIEEGSDKIKNTIIYAVHVQNQFLLVSSKNFFKSSSVVSKVKFPNKTEREQVNDLIISRLIVYLPTNKMYFLRESLGTSSFFISADIIFEGTRGKAHLV